MNLSLQKYLKFRLYLKDQMNLKYLLLLEVLVDPIRLKRFLVDLEVLVDLEGLGVQFPQKYLKFRLYPKDQMNLKYLLLLEVLVDQIRLKRFLVDLEVLVDQKR